MQRRILRSLEKLFLAAGLAGVGVYVGSIARMAVWQSWDNWAFSRELEGRNVSIANYVADMAHNLGQRLREWAGVRAIPALPRRDATLPSPSAEIPRPLVRENDLIGRLDIPRLNVAATVREGVEDRTLGVALGHIPTTAFPGEPGNVGVAGHRDTFFRSLGNIRKNDLIRFETLTGTYTYRVGSLEIVEPEDVDVLRPGKNPELTLVTCYPFNYVGSAPERLVVKGNLVGESAAVTNVIPAKVESKGDARASEVRGHGERRIGFTVPVSHSRSLAPGISLGVTEVDPVTHTINGWIWLMPDRRTIWLKQRHTREPVVFYGHYDGKPREVLITSVNRDRVTGYLRLSD